MASGHVSRIKRPNTWLHRPMLQNVKKALANSEPSTHVSRIKRPNTWLHRPMLQNVKKALANSEPSTHGTERTKRPHFAMSVYRVPAQPVDATRRGALPEADISTCAVASGPKCPRCTAMCIGQHD